MYASSSPVGGAVLQTERKAYRQEQEKKMKTNFSGFLGSVPGVVFILRFLPSNLCWLQSVRGTHYRVATQQQRKTFLPLMSSVRKKRKLTPSEQWRQSSAEQQWQLFQNSQEERCGMSKKLLVDVDSGVDDAQAIMLALGAPDVTVLGVTCVHGNTTVENVCRNTLRVLKACNQLEIPVFKGADKPILGNMLDPGHFHGQDGLGDAPDPNAPGLDLLQKENAVSAMIRIVNENPGEVSLVATAPLTNLALAVRMDPSLPSKLRGLYIMGGNTESRGNTSVCGEFNFTADPEAAYIVLNEYQCPTYLACWEFTCHNKLSWEFCDTWLAQDSHKARFMSQIFQHSIEAAKTERFQKECVAGAGFISCDSYAMAAALDDSFIIESDCYPVSVELTGTHTRGMMVVDTVGFLKKTHKAFIMKKVDLERFKQMMMAALK
uniref:Si:dkey-4e7.3 n=3 Tax=Nothobranchius TaxID=28779 RepID=A0A8C6PH92_NOTFU